MTIAMGKRMGMTAESLLAIIQARGSNATTLRDAVHEAAHALQAGLRRPWTRENIHRGLERLPDLLWVSYEVDARAVEQVVGARLAVDVGTVEAGALIATMEMARDRTAQVPVMWFVGAVQRRLTSRTVIELADAIMRLRARPANRPPRLLDPLA